MKVKDIFAEILCNDDLKDMYPGLSALFEFYLLMPLNTAVCERGFSTMKRVKCDWRSSLQATQLQRLVYLAIEGPRTEDYNPARAVESWWTSGQHTRRPGFSAWEGENLEQDFMDLEEIAQQDYI